MCVMIWVHMSLFIVKDDDFDLLIIGYDSADYWLL